MEIMRDQVRAALEAAHSAGFGAAADRTMGLARALLTPGVVPENRRARRQGARDGLPIPPDHLIYLVTGSRRVEQFLASGARTVDSVRSLLRRAGYDPGGFRDVLDFGCGCGRVLRHLVGRGPARLHGSDYNEEHVAWIAANLPGVGARVNAAQPPTAFSDESFDFVYAFSVFTHFGDDLQRAWMAEMRRLLRPGGVLLFTVHGQRYRDRLTASELERFERGELVTRYGRAECSNLCAAYHPEAYVRALIGDFEPRLFAPGEKHGTGSQDAYVVARPF